MLATLREPPPRGSLQESVLKALLIKKDQIEYLKTKSIVQAIVNAEEAPKALESYRDLQFPYFQKAQQSQRDEHIKKLMQEISRGPLRVIPLAEKRIRSKLKTRVVERMTPEQMEAAKRISKKLGGII